MQGTHSSITIARPHNVQVFDSITVIPQYSRAMHATRDRDYFTSRGDGHQKGVENDIRQDNRQASWQDWYQLSIAEMMQEDDRRCGNQSSRAADTPPTETSSTSTATPKPADDQEHNWSSGKSDAGQSDCSSLLEDVIPPSIWRVGRPATTVSTTASSLSAPPKPRRYTSMSHVGPSPNVSPPSFWGVVKHPVLHATKPPLPASPTSTRARRRPPIARRDPAWQAAMASTGKGISVTMGLYLDGEITVNGQHAATVPRDPPCQRCKASGRECRVVDCTKEKNIISGSCSYCIRQRKKCAT